MQTTDLPMASDALKIRPPLPSQIPVTERIEQAIALLLGYNNGQRIPLQCSPAGVIFTASPRLADVFHWTSVGAAESKQGDPIQCTEILCMAHPDNAGRIWVRTRKAALSTNAIPLDKGDVIGFSVENLNELYALTVLLGDTLIVGYSL